MQPGRKNHYFPSRKLKCPDSYREQKVKSGKQKVEGYWKSKNEINAKTPYSYYALYEPDAFRTWSLCSG